MSKSTGKKEAFFRCWTRKEAYLKAEGMGLTDFLSNISVDMSEFPTDDCVEILALNKKENLHWKLFPLHVDKFYTAAVVSTHYPKRLVGYTVNYIKNLSNVGSSK
nr:4'-phosphopantetheinyl transferase superfamily protein [Rickettsiella endosymbiont of Dermanyssus gallinae]